MESEVLDSCLSRLELAIIERISSKIEESKVGRKEKEMMFRESVDSCQVKCKQCTTEELEPRFSLQDKMLCKLL